MIIVHYSKISDVFPAFFLNGFIILHARKMLEKCQKMAPLQKITRNLPPPPGNGILGSSDCTLTLIQSNICGTVSLAIILCGLTTPEENRKKYLGFS